MNNNIAHDAFIVFSKVRQLVMPGLSLPGLHVAKQVVDRFAFLFVASENDTVRTPVSHKKSIKKRKGLALAAQPFQPKPYHNDGQVARL